MKNKQFNGSDRISDLAARARFALEQHPHFHHQTKSLQFESIGDLIIVSGILPSYYLKQHLQEALKKVEGVAKVDNQIIVVDSRDDADSSTN